MSEIARQLALLDRNGVARRLELVTPREGPIDLDAVIKYHVQGITRADQGNKATLVFSVSGQKRGLLWFAQFDLLTHAGGPARLAPRGRVVASVETALPHPGGMQASGDLLAVACEADKGWARLVFYDIADPSSPRLVDQFSLNNSLCEGVSQQTRSSAGWLAFAQCAPGEYLLFVGGRSFGTKEGWFYRYRPNASPRWEFAGNFAGAPRSSDASPWGPQSGAALVRASADAPFDVVTFGSKGAKGKNALRSRVRCFSVDTPNPGPCELVHQPPAPPAVFSFPRAKLSQLFGPNARWGTTAFVEPDGSLLAYFTARNPRPNREGTHVLRFHEVRRS